MDDDLIEIKWHVGLALPKRGDFVCRVTDLPPEPRRGIMGMLGRGPLKNMVSAWGDHDTPDHDGLASGGTTTLTDQEIDDRVRYKAEQDAALAAQNAILDAKIEAAKKIERLKREALEKLAAEAAHAKLELLDGFGSF